MKQETECFVQIEGLAGLFFKVFDCDESGVMVFYPKSIQRLFFEYVDIKRIVVRERLL